MSVKRTTVIAIVVCMVLACALGACSGDDATNGSGLPDTAMNAAGTSASEPEPEPEDGEPTAETDDASSEPEGETVQDRCVSPSCERSLLPPQPELPFLEEMGEGWVRLMEMDWSIAAGAEGYRCKTFTLPHDVYVTAFAPQVPVGSHHVTFDIAPAPTAPDAVYPCSVATRGERKLQGAGVGSDANPLPAGVAMPLREGEQVEMNLHLFNPNDEVLQGRAGMWIKTVPAGEVQQRAEVVLVGPRTLDIPVGRSQHGASCVVRDDATVFGVSPHMHFTGVHARASVTKASGETMVLHDGPFDPYDAEYYAVDPIELATGDTLDVECTFENDTDRHLQWGDSALEEMCFVNFSLYPALPYGNGPCDW